MWSCHTDNAAGGLQGLGLAVQLVAEAFDVVQAICNDNVIPRQDPLDGRIFFRTGILLGSGRAVDGARHAQHLVVDEMDLEAGRARIGRRAGNLGLEKLLQLGGSGGFARRRESWGGLATTGAGQGRTWRGGGT